MPLDQLLWRRPRSATCGCPRHAPGLAAGAVAALAARQLTDVQLAAGMVHHLHSGWSKGVLTVKPSPHRSLRRPPASGSAGTASKTAPPWPHLHGGDGAGGCRRSLRLRHGQGVVVAAIAVPGVVAVGEGEAAVKGLLGHLQLGRQGGEGRWAAALAHVGATAGPTPCWQRSNIPAGSRCAP